MDKKNLPSHYEIKITDPKKTGLRLFKLTDKNTNIVVNLAEFNKDFDVHSTVAWAGARTSRSIDPYENIFEEINTAANDNKYSAGEKLAKVFVNYGHASVADMAPLMLYINNIPIHLAFWIFNHTSVGAGQELSTRYVSIDDFRVPDFSYYLGKNDSELDKKWKKILNEASKSYKKWYDLVKDSYKEYFSKNNVTVSKSTLTARVLDIARMWIPVGTKTSMTLLTSVRNWIDIVIQLRESSNEEYNALGEQIFYILNLKDFKEAKDLKADLAGLTKYSEGKFTIEKSKNQLKNLLSDYGLNVKSKFEKITGEKNIVEELDDRKYDLSELMIMQYISTIYPCLTEEQILTFIKKLKKNQLEKIGEVILKGHTHHNLLRNIGDVRGKLFSIRTSLAYVRDLIRHRAMGRLVPMLESKSYRTIIEDGFNLNYQIENSKFLIHLKKEWVNDFKQYYNLILEFYDLVVQKYPDLNMSFIYNILPLGHQTKFYISGPITQFNYLNSLRITLGGDFGYRAVVYDLLNELRKDPVLKNMLSHIKKPDPNDLEQIMGRS